jgi:hypothetical protein
MDDYEYYIDYNINQSFGFIINIFTNKLRYNESFSYQCRCDNIECICIYLDSIFLLIILLTIINNEKKIQ